MALTFLVRTHLKENIHKYDFVIVIESFCLFFINLSEINLRSSRKCNDILAN